MSFGVGKNVNHGIVIYLTRFFAPEQNFEMTTNNSSDGIKEKVHAFVLEYAAGRGVTSVGDDEPILTNNIIDSLGSLRMIDFLETAFPLTIEDTDMLPENFQTLNACEIFIKGKLGIVTHDPESDDEKQPETNSTRELVNA